MTLGTITQEAVEISSGVSPEVGKITSPTLLKYCGSMAACVFLTTSEITSLYVVYSSPYKMNGVPSAAISAFDNGAPFTNVPSSPI